MKTKALFLFFTFAISTVLTSFAEAAAPGGGPREREFRRGRGSHRGNERSERPISSDGRPARMGNAIRDRDRDQRERRLERFRDACPEGSASVVMAPDGLSFTLIFDQFIAQTSASTPAGNAPGRGPFGGRGPGGLGGGGMLANADLARCHLVVPIEVPAGMRMSITSIDYRGFANLAAGANAVLRSSYSFANGRGEANLNYRFTGPLSEDYTLTNDATGDRDIVSSCGGTNNLRIANMLRLRAPRGVESQITLDSVDGSGQLVYYINWERCR